MPEPEESLSLYPPGALQPDERPSAVGGHLDDPGHPHDIVAGVLLNIAPLHRLVL